jgi:hypothetical protein
VYSYQRLFRYSLEGRNRVDYGLEPGSLLAELFESIAQFVAFRNLEQLKHARSVHEVSGLF